MRPTIVDLTCNACHEYVTITADVGWVMMSDATGMLHFECPRCDSHQVRDLGPDICGELVAAGMPTAPPTPPLDEAAVDAFADVLTTALGDELLAAYVDDWQALLR